MDIDPTPNDIRELRRMRKKIDGMRGDGVLVVHTPESIVVKKMGGDEQTQRNFHRLPSGSWTHVYVTTDGGSNNGPTWTYTLWTDAAHTIHVTNADGSNATGIIPTYRPIDTAIATAATVGWMTFDPTGSAVLWICDEIYQTGACVVTLSPIPNS